MRNSNQIDAQTFLEERNRNSSFGDQQALGFGSVDTGAGWSTLRSFREPIYESNRTEKRIEIDPTEKKRGDDSIESPSDSEREQKDSQES